MLGAMGCNPEAKGNDLADIGGASLGELRYSTDGGIYIAIRAGGSVTQYELCFIGGNLDAVPNASIVTRRGVPCCIPQVSLADNEYGWGLVAGTGRVRTDGGINAASGAMLDAINEELDTAAGTGGNVIVGLVLTANDGTNDGSVYVQFPAVGGGVA